MILEKVKPNEMEANAQEVAAFLKAMASPLRLQILCKLAEGEQSVSELIDATGIAQTSMSQHLKKLKSEGLVDFRRDHRTLYYSITHPVANQLMAVLYEHFCNKEKK